MDAGQSIELSVPLHGDSTHRDRSAEMGGSRRGVGAQIDAPIPVVDPVFGTPRPPCAVLLGLWRAPASARQLVLTRASLQRGACQAPIYTGARSPSGSTLTSIPTRGAGYRPRSNSLFSSPLDRPEDQLRHQWHRGTEHRTRERRPEHRAVEVDPHQIRHRRLAYHRPTPSSRNRSPTGRPRGRCSKWSRSVSEDLAQRPVEQPPGRYNGAGGTLLFG